MSTTLQVLLLLLGALPYFGVILYLLITRKLRDFSISTMLLGAFGILVALGVGALGGFLIISNYPQTGSTITDSFLITVLAVVLGVALIAGELFRFFALHRSVGSEGGSSVDGLAFGVGYSLGEYVFFAGLAIMNWGSFIQLDASIMILVDVLIQLLLSIAAYELIKQDNYASIAVGGLYFLSLFLAYVFNGSAVVNITAKVIVLAVAVALSITFWPGRNK